MADALDAWLAAQGSPAAAPAAGGDALDRWMAAQGAAGSLPEAAPPSTREAVARGALQGASLGFGDEAAAAIDTVASKIPGVRSFAQMFQDASLPRVDNPDLSYSERRDAYRKKNKAAQEEHPYAYGAGELAGGIATSPLLPGGAAATGVKMGAKAAALAAAKAGATAGAIQGLGSSEADLTKGDVAGALRDTRNSALAGAAFGGALGYLGGRLVEKAEKNAAGWVVKDISGEVKGASTPTARKQLADDAESAARLVLSDKEMNKAIDKARHGGVDQLEAAQDVVRKRLGDVGGKLDPRWKEVDKLLPDGGVKAGELVDHLTAQIEDLRATGHTTDAAEADALEGIVKRVTGARNFGFKSVLNHDAAVSGGALDGMPVRDALALLEKQKAANPALAGDLDNEIGRITSAATSKGFDPNHIVSAQQIQRLWSDEAGVAYNSMGWINGTQAFTRKLDVARHLRDFRDAIFEAAAEGNPKLVEEIRAINKDYSGLKRIDKVLEQRLNSARANAGGASVPASLSQFGHKLMHQGGLGGAGVALATGHPIAAAGMAAIPAAVAGKRILDRSVAGAIGRAGGTGTQAETARRILQLIQQGVPRAAAIKAAQSAAPGGVIREQADQLRDDLTGL